MDIFADNHLLTPDIGFVGTLAVEVDNALWNSPIANVAAHPLLPASPPRGAFDSRSMMLPVPRFDQIKTWLIRTQRGRAGLLQINGPSDNPRGVKVRYKLLPPITAAAQTRSPFGKSNHPCSAHSAWPTIA